MAIKFTLSGFSGIFAPIRLDRMGPPHCDVDGGQSSRGDGVVARMFQLALLLPSVVICNGVEYRFMIKDLFGFYGVV